MRAGRAAATARSRTRERQPWHMRGSRLFVRGVRGLARRRDPGLTVDPDDVDFDRVLAVLDPEEWKVTQRVHDRLVRGPDARAGEISHEPRREVKNRGVRWAVSGGECNTLGILIPEGLFVS